MPDDTDAYDQGYLDGYEQDYSDWYEPLSAVLPAGVDVSPAGAADYIAVLRATVDRLVGRLVS